MPAKRPWTCRPVALPLLAAAVAAATAAAAGPSRGAHGAGPGGATRTTARPGPAQAPAAQAPAARPNIIVVLADDLDDRLGTLSRAHHPNIHRLVADAGVSFERAFVTDALCCPSRTTLLRGQYTHNHGVYTNGGASGGYERYGPLDLEASTLATWLQAAGYRTGLFGKYINGYPLEGDPDHVPPGWSTWVSPAAGNPYGSYNYTLNVNGAQERHGRAAEDHITDVLAGHADAFVARAAADGAPFFALVAPYAPHAPADPAPRHAALLPDLAAPRGGSYDEADVSDKPAAIAGRPPLRPAQQAAGDALHRNRVLSMMAVDEMVERLVATLEATGQLADTVVLFTSDNGFHIGQHRLPQGKMTAYEEDIRVPLFVRGPGIWVGKTDATHLVGNVDLAPTLAELAGARTPDFVDGRSFAPLLWDTSDMTPAPTPWRRAFVVEQYPFENERGVGGTPAAAERAGLREPLDGDQAVDGGAVAGAVDRTTVAAAAAGPAPVYVAVRTDRHTYVEHATGERELYDNDADPYQLDNLASTAHVWTLAVLSAWAHELHACAGADCRTLEARQPIADVPTPTDTAAPRPSATATPRASMTAPPTPPTPAHRIWLPLVAAAWDAADARPPAGATSSARATALASASPAPTRAPSTRVATATAIPTPSPTSPPPPAATPTAPPLSAAGCPQAAAYSAAADGVSLYVLRDGVPVCADYPNGGAPDAAWGLASGTKSFSGVMAAAAIEDGLLSGWDEVVADTITEWRGDPRKGRITVRQLLSLTSGLDAGAVGSVPTYAEAVAAPAVREPGAAFDYGPVPYQVFGELMRRKLAGRYADPLAYLDDRVLGPIGARYDSWRRGTDGMPRLPSGAAFRASEWATFGELVRRHGRVGDRQLVRTDLLAECFVGSDVRPTYGLTWWLLLDLDRPAPGAPARVVAAKGAGIQRLYVLDRHGLVAVRQTASQLDGAEDGARFGDAAFLGRLLDDLGLAP